MIIISSRNRIDNLREVLRYHLTTTNFNDLSKRVHALNFSCTACTYFETVLVNNETAKTTLLTSSWTSPFIGLIRYLPECREAQYDRHLKQKNLYKLTSFAFLIACLSYVPLQFKIKSLLPFQFSKLLLLFFSNFSLHFFFLIG